MLLILTLVADSFADGKCDTLVTIEPLVLAEGAPPGWPASAELIVQYTDDGVPWIGMVRLEDGGSVSWGF